MNEFLEQELKIDEKTEFTSFQRKPFEKTNENERISDISLEIWLKEVVATSGKVSFLYI